MKKYTFRTVHILLLTFSFNLVSSAQTLEEQIISKIRQLDSIIQMAESHGIDAKKEKMTIRVAELTVKYAKWDDANKELNKESYAKHVEFKTDPQKAAEELPDFERQSAISILDGAINTLNELIAGNISRKQIPFIDYDKVTLEGSSLMQDGKPIFGATYTWIPGVDELSFFGGDGSKGLRTVYIKDDKGAHETWTYNDWKNDNSQTIGGLWNDQNNVPDWAKTKYPDIQVGGRHYGKFDIDHAGSREIYNLLFDTYIPLISGKRSTQLGYQLWNEPSFPTKADSWNNVDDNGICVSDSTIAHFRKWLPTQHESISDLNSLWRTSFTSFDEVTTTLPMPGSKQGGAEWYDWMTFNNYRVTEWFKFMKEGIRRNDPQAKVLIKLMPWLWANNGKDHGMDFEALTEVCDIIGPDIGAQYYHSWSNKPILNTYAFDWRAALMTMDFFKSVQPNQVIYDTENHFLMNTGFNPADLNQEYVKGIYWLGTVFGLNYKSTWVWSRNADGSITRGANAGYIVDVTHQPKTLNTITSTYMDMNCYAEELVKMQRQKKPIRVFYSATSAINKATHMDDVFETYEQLVFNGIPVGFATKNILQKTPDWEVVVIQKSDYVTQAEFGAVQAYLNNGGHVIMDNVSLKKDQYGKALGTLDAGAGTLTISTGLSDMKQKAFDAISDPDLLPTIRFNETNSIGTPGCLWRTITNEDGNIVLFVMNMGKDNANINFALKSGSDFVPKNLLTQNKINDTLSLKPFESLFCVLESNPVGINDSIVSFEFPVKIKPARSDDFTVSYETSVPREIYLSLKDTVTGEVEASKRYSVFGKGTTSFSFSADQSIPEADTYQWVLSLIPKGGDSTDIIGNSYAVDVIISSKVIPTALNISQSDVYLKEQDSLKLLINWMPVDANDTSVIWTSSDTNIVMVNSTGMAHAVATGSAYIKTVSSVVDLADSCLVTVIPPINIPDPWKADFIGPDPVQGTANFTSDTFQIVSGGADIWNETDDFMYVHQSYSGDVEIIAKVNSLSNTNTWAKAGLMIRNNLSEGSEHIMTVATSANGVRQQYRSSANEASSSDDNFVSTSVPVWLKMIKIGNRIFSYSSQDGTNWAQTGSKITINLADTFQIGLCLTSHAAGTYGTAVISNVSVTSPDVTRVSGIEIIQDSIEIINDLTSQLSAAITPEDAFLKDYVWSSRENRIASVNASGVVSAKSVDSTWIYVTSNDGFFMDSCFVTVLPVIVTGISLNKTVLTLDNPGDSIQISALIQPLNATNGMIIWSSDKPDIASVSAIGMVKGMDVGTAIITAKTEDGGFKASCTISILNTAIKHTHKSMVKCYPIPCTDVLHLEFPVGHTFTHLRLVDITGRTLSQKDIRNKNSSTIQMKAIAQKRGLYFIHLKGIDQQRILKVVME